MQFDEGKLRGAIDGNEHVQLALFGAHLGNVDVEVSDRVALELLLRRPVAVDRSFCAGDFIATALQNWLRRFLGASLLWKPAAALIISAACCESKGILFVSCRQNTCAPM